MRYFCFFLLFLINESLMSHNLGLHISLQRCSDFICKPGNAYSESLLHFYMEPCFFLSHCHLWVSKRPLFIVTVRKNMTRNKYFIYPCEDNVVIMFLIEQSI